MRFAAMPSGQKPFHRLIRALYVRRKGVEKTIMTKQVLFVQGGGKGTHDEWDNRLVASLERKLGAEYKIRYPPMPNEADPNYSLWKTALKKEFASLKDGAILVGHSIGATILINVLAEEPAESAPSGIFLIAAAFVGNGGWPSEDIKPMSDL